MPLSTKLKLTTLLVCFAAITSVAQQAKSFAVMLERVGTSTPVMLKWNYDSDALSYTIYRRLPGAFLWGTAIGTKTATDSTFTDNGATNGVYEYYVEKKLINNFTGHGYIIVNTAIQQLAKTQRVLVLIDANYRIPLQAELSQLVRDYAADGWYADTLYIQRTSTPVQVKGKIKIWYDTYKNDDIKPQSLYLLGHIPVPYSGALFPDGHRPDHRGAWPADVYYGVMNESIWTDNTIDMDSSADARNHNFPGDGKFDISFLFPDTCSLEIGRVDLTNMPAFADSDTMLTKAYLIKAHAFKTADLVPQRKAIIDDHFGAMNGEAFAANGYRNFSTMIGADNVIAGDFLPSVKQSSYLLSYGCGAGTYISAYGVANTPNLVSDSINTTFTMLFGSYFGDWDNENNFLRAPLCSKPMSLASAWSGRPNWPLHHMSMGYSIGHCARLTQNNMEGDFLNPPSLSGYRVNNFPTFIHIALMGDPGLRLFYNAMPQNVTATPNSDSTQYTLNWDAQSGATGYEVYASQNLMHGGKLIGSSATNTATITTLSPGINHVYVRAKYTESGASGPFTQLSLGSYVTVIGGEKAVGIAERAASPILFTAYPNPSTNRFTIAGNFSGATMQVYDVTGKLVLSENNLSGGTSIDHRLKPGLYVIRLEAAGKTGFSKILVN
ncbi:MAG: T9SS type A sorting domain-containing protein [Bacteroidota bacterium]